MRVKRKSQQNVCVPRIFQLFAHEGHVPNKANVQSGEIKKNVTKMTILPDGLLEKLIQRFQSPK